MFIKVSKIETLNQIKPVIINTDSIAYIEKSSSWSKAENITIYFSDIHNKIEISPSDASKVFNAIGKSL